MRLRARGSLALGSPALWVSACFAPLLVASGCNRAAPAAPIGSGSIGTPADGPGVPRARVVVGKPVRKTLVVSTTQPAQIEAFDTTPLVSRISGYIGAVLVDIGDTVTKGQTLVELSVPEMHDDLDQKKALVEQAEAELAEAAVDVEAAAAAVDTAEARIARAEAGVIHARGDFERSRSEHARYSGLAADRSVTQKLVDESKSQFAGAEGAYHEALANVQSTKALAHEAQVAVRKATSSKAAFAARLDVARANLAQSATLLEYTKITAPYDGVVTARGVAPGDYVTPPASATLSARPLLVVASASVARVFVETPEIEAALVDRGDKATVRVPALGQRVFEASVTRSSWSLDPVNRSLRVEVDIVNADLALRPGMYATATIVLDQRLDALTLPAAAIVREGAESMCCVVESGRIARRRVEIGPRGGGDVEILKGLEPDDSVVLARAESLADGQNVEAVVAEKK